MKKWKAGLFTASLAMVVLLTFGCELVSVFEIGDTVPDFIMPDQHGDVKSFSEELDKPGINGAILAFYILDNSPG